MTQAGIPFEEVQLRLDWDDDSPFKKTLLALAPTGPRAAAGRRRLRGLGHAGDRRVPGREASRQARSGPRDRRQRARARSLCAEMHSGFARAAQPLPDEHRGVAARGRRALLRRAARRSRADLRAHRRDVDRAARPTSGGPFLFGAFSIADAYFAPVCARAQDLRAAGRRRGSGRTSSASSRCRRCRRGATRRAGRARLHRGGRAVPRCVELTTRLGPHEKSGPEVRFSLRPVSGSAISISPSAATGDEAHRAQAGQHQRIGLGLGNRR